MYHSFLQQDLNNRKSLSGYDLITDTEYSSARSCESILVCTGVYNRHKHTVDSNQTWKRPTIIQDDILDAVKYILNKENQS
jgi:ribonucleotide monophosphatase NagD (HAD superfamily)